MIIEIFLYYGFLAQCSGSYNIRISDDPRAGIIVIPAAAYSSTNVTLLYLAIYRPTF